MFEREMETLGEIERLNQDLHDEIYMEQATRRAEPFSAAEIEAQYRIVKEIIIANGESFHDTRVIFTAGGPGSFQISTYGSFVCQQICSFRFNSPNCLDA